MPSTVLTEFLGQSILWHTCSLFSLFCWWVVLFYKTFDVKNMCISVISLCPVPQNMFLAIINDTYTEVKEELSSQKDELQITDIIKQVKSDSRKNGHISVHFISDTNKRILWCNLELHEDIYKAETEEGEDIRCSESTDIRIGRNWIQGFPGNSQRVSHCVFMC